MTAVLDTGLLDPGTISTAPIDTAAPHRAPADRRRPDGDRVDRGERGSVSIAGALFGIGIFTLIGLVLFHGQSLASLSRTREAADNAARAGAQQIDTDHLLATGEVRIDAGLAADAVSAYAANLPFVTVLEVRVDGATITVTVAETVDSVTGLGGQRTFTATESATALRGVTGAID